MSKRSVKSVGGKSTTSKGKAPPAKKEEPCDKCSEPSTSRKVLPCNHGYCQSCLKTIVKEPDDKDGGVQTTMAASTKGGKKASAAPPEEYVCPICNPPPPDPSTFEHGECAPCKFEEKTNPATGFCIECGELLCETCCTEHNKFKTIRAHKILTGDKIPKDTGAVARLPLLMMCMKHPEKDLEYYCADHDVMACSACVNLDHRRCERVMFIKDITDEPSDRKLVADAAVEMRDIKKNFDEIQKDTDDILTQLEMQRSAIRERRDNFRNKIISLLDNIEQSSEKEMEDVIYSVSKDLGEDSKGSKEIISQIESAIEMLDAAAGHASHIQMFVAGRRSAADRDKHIQLLNNSMGTVQNINMEFKPEPSLERMIRSLDIFEGRCIGSSKANGYKTQNGFPAPRRNGFIAENEIQPSKFGSRTDLERPDSGYSGRFSRFQTPRSDGLPQIASSQNSLATGSVPDFRSVGLRRHNNNGGRFSVPQTPNMYQNQMEPFEQTRSMPPTPRYQEIGRTQLNYPAMNGTMTNFNHTTTLPMIHHRGPQSDPGFRVNPNVNRDFAPMSPRNVGNNALMNQGLTHPSIYQPEMSAANRPMQQRQASMNQLAYKRADAFGLPKPEVSQVDILSVNRPLPDRRSSVASQLSFKPPASDDGKELPSKSQRTEATTNVAQSPRAEPTSNVTQSPRTEQPPSNVTQLLQGKRRPDIISTPAPLRERNAIEAGQFNIRLKEDKSQCSLKGTAVLADGRIVMADYDNHNVKVFDSKIYRGDQLLLSSGPWDITVTGPTEVAVTLPFESKIQFISITNQIKATRSIKMDMDCYGLVCRNQELIVVCNDYLIGPAVQVLSLTGRVKQTIDTDRDGRRILTDPYYLAVTPTGKQIYVADKDRIVCMDRHSNVTSVYQEPSLKNARGIDLDSEGNLYVCGYMSNNVVQITMHGIDFRCLIETGQIWDPWSVRFNETNGTLLITSESSDTVKVFTLQ